MGVADMLTSPHSPPSVSSPGKACYMGSCSTPSLQPVKSHSSVSRTTDVTVCTVGNNTFKQGFIQPGS